MSGYNQQYVLASQMAAQMAQQQQHHQPQVQAPVVQVRQCLFLHPVLRLHLNDVKINLPFECALKLPCNELGVIQDLCSY